MNDSETIKPFMVGREALRARIMRNMQPGESPTDTVDRIFIEHEQMKRMMPRTQQSEPSAA